MNGKLEGWNVGMWFLASLGAFGAGGGTPSNLPTIHPSNLPSSLTIARFHYDGGGDWYANPSSLPNLLKALRERTTLSVADPDTGNS